MQVVILAGGLGTRLMPLTKNFPKAMIQVSGKPFVDYQIRHLLKQGFNEILIISGYKSEMLEDFVQKQAYASVVDFLNEGNTLRGTGGALAWAHAHKALQAKFLLLYGDSFLPIDFSKVAGVFQNSNLPGLMTVLKNEGVWDKSNVVYEFAKLQLYEKGLTPVPPAMKHVDYGLLGLTRELFAPEFLQKILGLEPQPEKWDLALLLSGLSKRGELLGFEVFERFYEIGSLNGLKDFEQLVTLSPWREFFDNQKSSV